MNDNNNSSADENIINAGEDGNDLNSNDDDASSPHPETDITDEYPALELGFTAETMTEIRNQWYRFNSVFLNHKEVSTLAVDKRQGLWKSICARVKVKNIKEFRANTLCKAHLFVVKNKVKSLCLTHTCSDDLVGRKRAYKFSQREATSEELRKIPKTSSSKSR